jgi:IclR family transcriptional regulator, mhp operon transcriptional activator
VAKRGSILPSAMAKRVKPIRSVVRALELLRAMNESREYSLRQLHERTGLPKPTLFRLLATLREIGYITADPPAGYRLTAKIRDLTYGYTDRSLVVEIAGPKLRAVTRTIKWPLAIGILEGPEIVVRFSTMPESPLAVEATTLGHRHGLLTSAIGQTYLAFCSAVERDALLKLFNGAGKGRRQPAADIVELVTTVRKRGYGLRTPKKRGESATIAVPIRSGERVFATLSMTTFGTLMDPKMIAQYEPVLTRTAADIVRELRSHRAEA